MAKPQENRKHKRIERRFPLKYKELRQDDLLPKGTISKNISEGGLRFRSDTFFSMASRLVLELNLPTIEKPIRAISRVAWIKKLPAGDDYEVGNHFVEITREDRESIRGFIDREFDKVAF